MPGTNKNKTRLHQLEVFDGGGSVFFSRSSPGWIWALIAMGTGGADGGGIEE